MARIFDRILPIIKNYRYHPGVERVLREVIDSKLDSIETGSHRTIVTKGKRKYIWWNENKMYGYASSGEVWDGKKLIFKWDEAQPKRKTMWELLDKDFYQGRK